MGRIRRLATGVPAMVLADWQVGEVFLSFLWFFIFFIWIWLLITVFADIFRDHELSGWFKALWVIFVIILPYLGVFVYLIARGGGMAQRSMAQQQRQHQQFDSYVQSVASPSPADELARLADLKTQGVISDAEFEQLKAKAIG
jgi:ABC-type multidrug transport system fused ATPase/permease subunit